MTLPKEAWLTLTTAVAANAKASEMEIIVSPSTKAWRNRPESAGWGSPAGRLQRTACNHRREVPGPEALSGPHAAAQRVGSPGDAKRVPERDAKIAAALCRIHPAPTMRTSPISLATPRSPFAAIAAQQQRERDERTETESMLMLIDSMDKDAPSRPTRSSTRSTWTSAAGSTSCAARS